MPYTRRVTKQRDTDRFTKSLSAASEILDTVIEKAEDRDSDAFEALEKFSKAMERVYRQAEVLETDDE